MYVLLAICSSFFVVDINDHRIEFHSHAIPDHPHPCKLHAHIPAVLDGKASIPVPLLHLTCVRRGRKRNTYAMAGMSALQRQLPWNTGNTRARARAYAYTASTNTTHHRRVHMSLSSDQFGASSPHLTSPSTNMCQKSILNSTYQTGAKKKLRDN